MLFNNRELGPALQFIKGSDFDIFCLQEVPETFLSQLKKLPCYFVSCVDVERLNGNEVTPIYLVVLSKYPIISSSEISLPDYQNQQPLRSRIFIMLMRLFHFGKMRNRHALFVDVEKESTVVRTFDLHLVLGAPEWRLKEFETAMSKKDVSIPTIVCGDFNLIESRRMSSLNWLLGGRVSDMFFYKRERAVIEKRFAEYELQNPLRGMNTHSFANSQLDHILASRSFSIKNFEVIPDRFGSDHHPIVVELT